MRICEFILCVSAPLICFFACQTTHAQERQVPPPEQSAALATPAAIDFPCSASPDRKLKNFYSFWRWKDQTPPLKVTVKFDKPGFGCVGEPLEITVPNDQKVSLVPGTWPTGCFSTTSIAPAPTDSAIPNIVSIIGGIHGAAAVTAQPLPTLKNKVLTVNVECDVSQQLKQTQIIKITYQNPPRIAVSGGFLVSPGVKSYGIKTTDTGVGANGLANVQNAIAVTNNPTAQVVPFSLVNLYLAGSRTLNLSSQVGVGVNPNLSSAKIEFFAAPVALAFKDFYFAPGIHFGQHEVLTGGFAVGDVVPSGFKPPIKWGIRGSFGFSISYNLKPLVKPSGK